MKTFAFIDVSNLFYGGEKSLSWKINYEKLFCYLKKKYNVSNVFYFGRVEIHNFKYDYQKEVIILGRGQRTAKEIRQFAGGDFKDFKYLREQIKREKK